MSIFTQVQQREFPGHFVWEDDLCFSIMTIAPIRRGHLLVIPNQEVDHWDDVPEKTAAHLMLVSQRIAKAMKAVIPCKRIGISVIGLEVPHTHIHLLPIDQMADMDFTLAKEMPTTTLAETAVDIRTVLLEQGYLEASIRK